ncbi:MAG: DNA primase [Gammaproteobacteria bacterium]|nr:DNA primase [Gammaproteobacteria bacterium]
MSGITKEWIRDLQTKVDAAQLIQQYVTLEKSGNGYKGKCPFHQDNTPSFYVYPNEHRYHCFGCGEHGDLIAFIQKQRNLSFMEAIETLAQFAGVEVPRQLSSHAVDAQARKNMKLYETMAAASSVFQKALQKNSQAKEYLESRGIKTQIAKKYGLGYAPKLFDYLKGALADTSERILLECGLLVNKEDGKYYDKFRDRIMFPIHDLNGREVGFGGRSLTDKVPKYLNSPETPLFRKGELLYGFHLVRSARVKLDNVIVVEGYTDVVMLAQHGFQNVVAPLGTALTNLQIQLLKRLSKQIVFCFDGDEAGQKATWRALENCYSQLEQGQTYQIVSLPQGYDPDSYVNDFGVERFQALIAAAPLSSKYFFDTLQAQYDLKSPESRMGMAEQAQTVIQKIPYEPFRELMIQELARITGVTLKRTINPSIKKNKKSFEDSLESPTERITKFHSNGNVPQGERHILKTLLYEMKFIHLLARRDLERYLEFQNNSLLFDVIARIHRNKLESFSELISSYDPKSWEYEQLQRIAKEGIPKIRGDAHYDALHGGIQAWLTKCQKQKRAINLIKNVRKKS